MNYSTVDSDWDQQLRDALADQPCPSEEELDEMLRDLYNRHLQNAS
jgi:hypothetical protein